MQAAVSALHSLRRCVGDVLPGVRPAHVIALTPHQPDELLAVSRIEHALVYDVHQTELPALSLHRRPVFSGAGLAVLLLPLGW